MTQVKHLYLDRNERTEYNRVQVFHFIDTCTCLREEEKSIVQQYAFGYDYGNAESCGMIVNQGMKYSKTVPSSIAIGSFSNLVEKREALGDTYERGADALRSYEYVIEINGSEFFVGELALNESRAASTGRG